MTLYLLFGISSFDTLNSDFHLKGWGDDGDELDMDADWGDDWNNEPVKKKNFSTKKLPKKKPAKKTNDIIVEDIPANMSALGLNSAFAETKGKIILVFFKAFHFF